MPKIEYVVPLNIDDRLLRRTARILEDGGLAALPTDSGWVIVCSMHSREGLKKLKDLEKGGRDERRFTLLCSDISQAGGLCGVDNTRFRLIHRLAPGPYVFILKTLLGTEKALGLRRQEAGVRIPNHPVPLALIKTLAHPLYSVTAKRSMIEGEELELGEDEWVIPEEELFEGGWELDAIGELDIILDSGEEQERIFSTILDLTGDEVRLIRAGAGPWPA